MKSIDILIAIISGSVVLTCIVTGFDFINKEKLAQVPNSVSFIIFYCHSGCIARLRRKMMIKQTGQIKGDR